MHRKKLGARKIKNHGFGEKGKIQGLPALARKNPGYLGVEPAVGRICGRDGTGGV